jgi:hypothetical protein
MTPASQRRRFLAMTGGATVALLAVSFIVINLLGQWFSWRWDMTDQDVYSLSPATRKLVRDMDDTVVIKAYFTPQLPPPYNVYRDYVRDLLQEYRAVSKGRIRYDFVSAKDPQSFEINASQAGLFPVTFEERGADNVQIRRGFMGLVLHYRDRTESLPVIRDIRTTEYDLTVRLARMVQTSKKKIIITTGHGEPAWRREPDFIPGRDLSDLFDIEEKNPAQDADLSADALIVAGPQMKMDDKALQAINAAVQKGIPTAFFVDSKKISVEQFFAQDLSTGLEPLLSAWGVQVGPGLVIDPQCENVAMSQNMGGLSFTTQVRYPYVPLFTRFPEYSPLFRGIDALGMPFVSSVTVTAASGHTLKNVPILFSSPKSWLSTPDLFSLAPTTIKPPASKDVVQSYPVAFQLDGEFPSLGAPGTLGAKNTVIVIGSSYLWNPKLPAFSGASEFLVNLGAVLTKDETLAGIRRKSDIVRPLRPSHPALVATIRYGAMLGMPVLFGLLGFALWRRRQGWREKMNALYVGNRS